MTCWATASQWTVVSNYREARLYAKSRGLGTREVFLPEEHRGDTPNNDGSGNNGSDGPSRCVVAP